jgi:hypothetical protein
LVVVGVTGRAAARGTTTAAAVEEEVDEELNMAS